MWWPYIHMCTQILYLVNYCRRFWRHDNLTNTSERFRWVHCALLWISPGQGMYTSSTVSHRMYCCCTTSNTLCVVQWVLCCASTVLCNWTKYLFLKKDISCPITYLYSTLLLFWPRIPRTAVRIYVWTSVHRLVYYVVTDRVPNACTSTHLNPSRADLWVSKRHIYLALVGRMGRPTRDGTADLSRKTKFPGAMFSGNGNQ